MILFSSATFQHSNHPSYVSGSEGLFVAYQSLGSMGIIVLGSNNNSNHLLSTCYVSGSTLDT